MYSLAAACRLSLTLILRVSSSHGQLTRGGGLLKIFSHPPPIAFESSTAPASRLVIFNCGVGQERTKQGGNGQEGAKGSAARDV
jgi:hypothetical protein